MTKRLTADEFEELLLKLADESDAKLDEDSWRSSYDEDLEKVWAELDDDEVFSDAGITVVEDFGGGEGSGETRWKVVSYNGQFFRKEGWYASYDGSHFDGYCEEKWPAKVIRTEWADKPTTEVIDKSKRF